MDYQTKPMPVKAEQANANGSIETGRTERNDPGGTVPAREPYDAGDWIVTTPNGITRVWKDAQFTGCYEPIAA